MTEFKLGFCNPPEPIYLYVKNGELGGESYLWYHYEIDNDKTIPVHFRGLTGYISELRLTTKEFKGKDNIKLDIVVNADEVYIIRTGIETNFAKAFLLSASMIEDFSKPLIIAAIAGKENVVFCNLYDATTKVRIHKEWDANADWAGLIKSIQSRMGAGTQAYIADPQEPVISQSQINRLWAIARTELKLTDETIKKVILSCGYGSSKEITANKYDAVINKLRDESVVSFVDIKF